MEEKAKELLAQYCYTHNTEISRRVEKLLDIAIDAMDGMIEMMEATDDDYLFLDHLIGELDDEELCGALTELQEYLFCD